MVTAFSTLDQTRTSLGGGPIQNGASYEAVTYERGTYKLVTVKAVGFTIHGLGDWEKKVTLTHQLSWFHPF